VNIRDAHLFVESDMRRVLFSVKFKFCRDLDR